MTRRELITVSVVAVPGFASEPLFRFWMAGCQLPADPAKRYLIFGLLAYTGWLLIALIRLIAKTPPTER